MRFYDHFVTCAPFTLLIITLLITGLLTFTIMVSPPPDLENPLKGAEARRTPIKGTTAALSNLMTGNLTTTPSVEVDLDKYQSSLMFKYIMTYNLMEACPDAPDKFSVTFASSVGTSLYTVEALVAMCQFAEDLAKLELVNHHCPVHSVGHHVALMRHTTCEQLSQVELDSALDVILFCVPFVFNTSMLDYSTPPAECSNTSSAHKILGYLSDISFSTGDYNKTFLEYAQLIIPLNDASDAADFYHQMMLQEYDRAYLILAGADPAVKLDLYSEYIKIDLSLFAAGLLLILILTYMYTRSVILTVALVMDVILSYSMAYFAYFMIFQIKFFPFMNLLAGLLVIAIAADDLYLFHDMWDQHKNKESDVNLSHILQKTFSHAALSIFTTSFTTAAALFANVFSHITIIKCFAVFCGTAILCNCFIVLTFIPAAVIVQEQLMRFCCARPPPEWCSMVANFTQTVHKKIFKEFLPLLINELYFVWIIIFLLLATGGFVAVYYYPGLNLPSSPVNQLLSTDQPPENYDMYLREKFQYELLHDTASSAHGLPLFFIWGLVPTDNGNPFNPEDNGTLIYDETFNLSLPESQTFMLKFCDHLKEQSFMFSKEQPCTLYLFNSFMTRHCPHSSLAPCCSQSSAPFPSELFMTCFPRVMKALYSVIPSHYLLGVPYFDEKDDIIAYMISCQSTQELVYLYDEMDAFYNKITHFIDNQNKKAPTGVNGGFVTANFLFYDIQISLLSGTYVAFGVSITIALAVLLMITCNVLTTLYSMATITFAIFVTIGTLALAGWELNVLESIILSTSVGLSIDFAIHYSVAYILSTKPNRDGRIRETFSRVGSPVAMAASTTFLAGLPCLTARVRGYQQLGEFLLVVMVVSWFYATFFFKSVSRFIGPLGNAGNLPLPWKYYRWCRKKKKQDAESNNKHQYAMKETTDPRSDNEDVTSRSDIAPSETLPINSDMHQFDNEDAEDDAGAQSEHGELVDKSVFHDIRPSQYGDALHSF